MAVQKTPSISSHIATMVNIPGYKIKDLLGRGGMAVVYLAIQESIGRKVALKVLTPDYSDDSFSERFLREAQIISHLTHPNIVTVFDAGVYQGCHYISMEYIPGLNLRQARDTLSGKEKINLIKQVALALDFAGKKGFVHRDIKPENILLHEDGRAILTDFGIARGMASNKSLTVTGKAIGTPYYMSPEQTKGLKDVDPRSDIYSLGVVLFQILAGYVPYDGDSIVIIGIKHISDPVPFLPKELAIFQPMIDKCMAKDPDQRYQTAGELYAALDAIPDKVLDEIEQYTAASSQSSQNHHHATIIGTDLDNGNGAAKKQQASKGMETPIPSFDITNTAEFKKLKTRSRIILLFVIFLLIAVGFYQQKEIILFWQADFKPWLHQVLPERILNIAKINSPTSQSASGTSDEESSPEGINNQLTELFRTLDEYPENINKIVSLYNETLASNPNDITAQQGLINLQNHFFEKIEIASNVQNILQARHLSNLLAANFTSITDNQKFQQIENSLVKTETVAEHLKAVEVFINSNSLLESEKTNAVTELQAALKIDPENRKAHKLKQDITNIFIQQVQQQSSDNLNTALQLTESGLTVSSDNPTLLGLQKALSSQINKQEHIARLLEKAEKQLATGNLVSPRGKNAYSSYHAVLGIQKNNITAKSGLKNIQSRLLGNARQATKNNKFKQARIILDSAQVYFKKSPAIIQAKKELEIAIDATLPKVGRILFSDKAINSLTEAQNQIIQPGRTLHIGFDYTNFNTDTTLIQANLLDGSGNVQIAQKPVIVSGNSGEHFFYIELPVEGFADGTYNLELLLNQNLLLKKSFQVKNKITE